MASNPPRPSLELRRLVNGYQVTQAIHVAAVLGIADLLASGPRTSDDLAEATGTHPDALYRLLRALASVGVFHEAGERRFTSTPLGDCLRSDAPESVHGWAAFVGESNRWMAWTGLEHNVRTGENAFRHVHGTDSWSFRAEHPELGTLFDRAMTSMSHQVSAAILATFDFGRFEIMVDVGGGNGAFLAAILAGRPTMRGVLFDQPHVVTGAGSLLAAAGVADRCEVVAGSFFESVPAGGDAYLLKAIIHDWEDEPATAILRTCRRAMRDGTALLVVERDLGPANEAPDSKFSDLNMMVGPEGRERSVAEYTALFEAAGFRFVGFTPSVGGFGVYEGIAV
ncbi:MAG: acetylserotonin O-methyltransferase [Chloroflexota bacterium]|nr:acetylserotonin O-methyltransferase [Chloroflexota bacterium]